MTEAAMRTGFRDRRMAVLWWAAMLLSAGLALVSWRYVAGVGPLAPGVIANMFAWPWLLIHVAGAATALLLVPLQLMPRLRAAAPGFHRWSGRAYALGCLIGATAGLVLALGSTAGPIAATGFGGLAICWFATTALGWRTALQRRFAAHRRWMLRSFALTFAAVTLRLYLPLVPLAGLSFMTGYRAISFLCWIPNLVLVELYLRRSRITLAESAVAGSSRSEEDEERSRRWAFAGS
jgi:hypothetical protein